MEGLQRNLRLFFFYETGIWIIAYEFICEK
jgi:hypothetical protein